MNRSRSSLVLLAAVSLVTAGSLAAAGPGGGGGGGSTTPPPDPAIAFADGGIKVMNADGTNQRTVVSLRRGENVRMPAWSPDSTALVFWGRLGGVTGIWTVPVAGGSPRFVASAVDPSLATTSEWSPVPTADGRYKIVFADEVVYGPIGWDRDIFVVNPDGTGRVNLTNTPNSAEVYAAWSRDGGHLAVIRESAELVIFELGLVDGSLAIVGETVVWTAPAAATAAFPRWASVSDQVAFSTSIGGLLRVVTLDLTNSQAVPELLTSNPTTDERWASFSPDDSRIVYHRGGASGGIYVINADGTGDRRIANRGYDPCWRRRP